MSYNKSYNIDTHMNNVVFDMCMNSDDGSLVFDYTFYGEHVTCISTISGEAYTDITGMIGIDITKYVLHCCLMHDRSHTGIFRLNIEIGEPGIITPIFKEI